MNPRPRFLPIALAATLFALFAGAASAQKSRMLEKAEPPPPPPLEQPAPADEPQVTIRPGKAGETVREFRLHGKLYMMQVIPAKGPSYYLIDERGDGQFTRRDALDSGLRVPQWVVKSW
jgi:hypothetical protein